MTCAHYHTCPKALYFIQWQIVTYTNVIISICISVLIICNLVHFIIVDNQLGAEGRVTCLVCSLPMFNIQAPLEHSSRSKPQA